MKTWKKYKLGKGLRGTFFFKARSIKEAWEKGCKMFNRRAFPTDSRSRGRHVVLYVYDSSVLPMFKTKWVIDQDTYRGFVPIAEGMSKQKLVFPKK